MTGLESPRRALAASESTARLVLALVACGLYLASLDFAPSGDAVYYANIIDTRSFDQLTLHQGYYVLGAAFAWVGALVGMSTIASLAVLNAMAGAAMLVVAHALFRQFGWSSGTSWIGVLVLFLCHRVFLNATTVECYATQTLFVWLVYLLFLRERFVGAGIAFAVSLWIAPLSAAFALGLPVVAWRRRWGFVPVLRVVAIAAALYAPFFVTFHDELLHGRRGLVSYATYRAPEPGLAAANFVRFQVKHYGLLCLFVVPALLVVRRHADLAWTTVAIVAPNLYVMTKLVGEDHVFFMPLDFLFAAWIALGFAELARRRLGWLAAAVVVGQLAVFAHVESTFLRPAHADVGERVRAIDREIREADDPVVIGGWGERMIYVYFAQDEPSYPLEDDPRHERITPVGDVAATDVQDREIFVLDSYRPSRFAALIRSEESLAARRRALSTRGGVESALGLVCSPVVEGPLTLYRCR